MWYTEFENAVGWDGSVSVVIPSVDEEIWLLVVHAVIPSEKSPFWNTFCQG